MAVHCLRVSFANFSCRYADHTKYWVAGVDVSLQGRSGLRYRDPARIPDIHLAPPTSGPSRGYATFSCHGAPPDSCAARWRMALIAYNEMLLVAASNGASSTGGSLADLPPPRQVWQQLAGQWFEAGNTSGLSAASPQTPHSMSESINNVHSALRTVISSAEESEVFHPSWRAAAIEGRSPRAAIQVLRNRRDDLVKHSAWVAVSRNNRARATHFCRLVCKVRCHAG